MELINTILVGSVFDKLEEIPDNYVDCVITSPPYFGLRDYKVEGQLGLEPTVDLYITHLVQIFDEVKRILKKEGTCWVVISDSFENKSKSLLMIPERFALKMIDNGWVLRNKIIWKKNNCMPSSAKDRFTIDYENIYFFTKSQKYFFNTQYEPYSEATINEFGQKYNGKALKDYESHGAQNPSDTKRRIIAGLNIKMPPIGGVKHVTGNDNRTYSGNTPNFGNGRIMRAVWTINPKPFRDAHFAVFPEKLVERCINAGCPINGVILDPFIGAGTTALVSLKMNRKFIGIELKQSYVDMAYKRIDKYLNQEKLI